MSRELFNDVVEPSIRIGTRPWYSVPLSTVSHLTVIGILVAAPLAATRGLPDVARVIIFTAPATIPVPPPPPVIVPRAQASRPNEFADANPTVPLAQDLQTSLPESSAANALALPPAVRTDGAGGTLPSFGSAPSAVLSAPPKVDNPRVLPVGGAVRAPVKIHDVTPVYPAVARAARAQGVVILEAVIARDGTVRDVRVIKSVPLLDQAAIDAVRGWRYSQPTLNGIPVDVSMTVRVMFGLN